MKKLLPALLVLLLTFNGCKKEQPAPSVPTSVTAPITTGTTVSAGTLTGTISPVGAAANITATITVNGKSVTYNATLDNNDGFKFVDLQPGTYIVSFSSTSGYTVPSSKTVTITAGQNTDVGTNTFSAAVGGGISGIIAPAGAATSVTMSTKVDGQAVFYNAIPDKNGRFNLTDLPPLIYLLSYTATSGYTAPSVVALITVNSGKISDIGTSTFTSTMGGHISGTISPAGAVTSVTAISGSNASYTASLAANGTFKFSDLPVGTYTVSFTTSTDYTPLSSKTVTVNSGVVSDMGIVFCSLTDPGSITGIINPIGASVSITANNTNFATTSYDNGVFKFSKLPAGTYTINFTPQTGFLAPANQTITITKGQNVDVGTVTLKATSPGSISGTISPAGSSVSVSAASNDYSSFVKYSVTPDASGRFQILNLPARQYYVIATPDPGSSLYAPYSRFYTVAAGQNTDVGNIGLTTAPPPYPFSCSLDGTSYNSTSARVAYLTDKKTLTISSSINGYIVSIYATGVNGTGDYPCNSSSGSVISCAIPPKSGPYPESPTTPSIIWNTKAAGGSGTIKISSIDPVNKTVSGTFSSILSPSTMNATGVKTITNGTFVNLQYQ